MIVFQVRQKQVEELVNWKFLQTVFTQLEFWVMDDLEKWYWQRWKHQMDMTNILPLSPTSSVVAMCLPMWLKRKVCSLTLGIHLLWPCTCASNGNFQFFWTCFILPESLLLKFTWQRWKQQMDLTNILPLRSWRSPTSSLIAMCLAM